MSELSLVLAPPPEQLATAAGSTTSPAAAAPGNAGKPFADLLAGMLAGTQPLAPVAGPLPADLAPTLAAEDLPDTDADPQALLALPGSAAPLPALPGEFATPGATGTSLPVAGNSLPAGSSPRADPVTEPAGPPQDPNAPGQNPAPGETRSRLHLTDLALNRKLEPVPVPVPLPAPEATGAIGRAAIDGSGFASQGKRTNDSASAALAFARKYLTQRSQAQGLPAMAASATPELAASTEFTAGMLAALTAGNAANHTVPAPAPLNVTDLAGSGSVQPAVREDQGTPPALRPLGDAASFAGGLADRLLALGGPGVQTARLKLHPEHLGALTVEIQIDDGTAQVWFGTTTSQAHSAIEGSLPRLRELFAEQGIALTRTQVDVGAGQMGNAGSDQQRRTAGGTRPDVDSPWRPPTPVRTLAVPGLPRSVSAPSQRLDVWA